MGLDVYIYSAKKDKNAPEIVRGQYMWGDLKLEAYWRKNYFINSFFGDIYFSKEKGNPDFNGVYIRLTLQDIRKLKKAVKKCSDESWEGNSLDRNRYPTIRVLRKLLSEMEANPDRIYYGLGSW